MYRAVDEGSPAPSPRARHAKSVKKEPVEEEMHGASDELNICFLCGEPAEASSRGFETEVTEGFFSFPVAFQKDFVSHHELARLSFVIRFPFQLVSTNHKSSTIYSNQFKLHVQTHT